jgi:RecA/RadA recombinase
MAKIKDKPASLNDAVSMAIKQNYDLEKFKKSKHLVGNIKFKDNKWIPLSEAFQEELHIPGIPMGFITLLRGHSDTGKTTALLESAASAQRNNVLPVFIITEMKWSWDHAKEMGVQVEDVVDKNTGEVVDYKGFFIYADRSSLETIEDVAAFIADLMDEQKKGTLPFDLLFLWDSVGSIPCRLSVESNKNNNEWNAGAMSQQFGNFINQKIMLSRKEGNPFTNTLVAINKVWVAKPSVPMEQPKMKNKGGDTMFFDSALIITFGNVTNPGTNKIKATKNGKNVEFAKRTKVSCDKNHVTDVTTKGTLIMTAHGFIPDDKKAIDDYKKKHSHKWLEVLGSTDFKIVEEEEDSSGVEFGAEHEESV